MRAQFKQKIFFWKNPVASATLVLNRHRIYILPNRAGLIYALLLLVIFITSLNYSLNLGYALDFLLISCGWLGIHLTHRNLSGIGLSAAASPPVYCGELAHFAIQLNNPTQAARYAISLGLTPTSMQLVDISAHSTHHVTLATPTQRRGWLSCPKIRIDTIFPYGLLTAWSYWQTTQQILVYPKPEPNPPPLPFTAQDLLGSQPTVGTEDLSGVRDYRVGDSFKQLAWRQIAKQSTADNLTLISKHFENNQQPVCLLDFAALPPDLSVEHKLSRLCAWLLAAEREQISYAFQLGHVRYAKNSGEDHQIACLTALALFRG
jgi:uncharacterized protein (DUF58 family)